MSFVICHQQSGRGKTEAGIDWMGKVNSRKSQTSGPVAIQPQRFGDEQEKTHGFWAAFASPSPKNEREAPGFRHGEELGSGFNRIQHLFTQLIKRFVMIRS